MYIFPFWLLKPRRIVWKISYKDFGLEKKGFYFIIESVVCSHEHKSLETEYCCSKPSLTSVAARESLQQCNRYQVYSLTECAADAIVMDKTDKRNAVCLPHQDGHCQQHHLLRSLDHLHRQQEAQAGDAGICNLLQCIQTFDSRSSHYSVIGQTLVPQTAVFVVTFLTTSGQEKWWFIIFTLKEVW